MSVARASDYVIRMIDYQRAMDMLLEAEQTMPDVFKAMRYNSDANVYDETYAYVYNAYIKENTGIPEHRIIYFIGQRAPGHAVTKILEVMVSGGMLKIADIAGPGGRPTYKPAAKADIG